MTEHPLRILESYFPTGTAEGDTQFLRRAFVQEDEYAELVTPPPGSPRLLVGRKGSGKSAIIAFSTALFGESGIPSLLIKPLDIDLPALTEGASVGEITRLAYEALIRAVGRRIGVDLKGMLKGEEKALYDEAVSSGLKDRDALEKLAAVLPKLAKPYVGGDLTKLLPKSAKAAVQKLERAIKSNLSRSETAFYLFLDDIDQVAAPDRPGHLNRIWGFILAERELTQRIPQLRCIICLREEVWQRLQRDRAGQRDQADHFVRLVHRLNPSRLHIRRILERRLELAANDLRDPRSPYDIFFGEHSPRMPSSEVRSSWDDIIVQRSRERPRDAIQLVGDLARHAIGRSAAKIEQEDLEVVMRQFSKERVDLLVPEVDNECPQAAEVVRSLAHLPYDQGAFKATAEPVRQHLLQLPSTRSITLFGRALQPGNGEDALELWKFLFEIGVLNARVADRREKDGYRHVFPVDDPGLVSPSRWNDMQGMVWEVNPAYRDELIRVQSEEAARTGLPPTRRRSR